MERRQELIQQNEEPATSTNMAYKIEQEIDEVVSFLAVDADKMNNIGMKYGDQATRNLSRAIGLRIQGQLRALFTPYPNCRLYHIYAGRFYLMLKGVSLELARIQAERLRQALKEPYHIDALRTAIDETTRPVNMVELSEVTVRVAVTSYPYSKLEDFLRRPQYFAVNDVIPRIVNSPDEALMVGGDEGGDVVISWDPSSHMFKRWSPKKGE
jgi:GGDEF domain-containing protein